MQLAGERRSRGVAFVGGGLFLATVCVWLPYSFDQRAFELTVLWAGVVDVAKPTVYRVSWRNGWADEVQGSFTYREGALAGGSVTAYSMRYEGAKVATLDGISVPVSAIAAAAATDHSTADDLALVKGALCGNDKLSGNIGNDILLGYDGHDVMAGGSGKDQLNGGSGSDRLVGGLGRDFLTGGDGADVFDFNRTSESSTLSGFDRINDFRRGQDRIDLSSIDADPGTTGNQAFAFIGNHAFSGVGGQLRFHGGTVYGDTDGDKAADFAIEVTGLTAMDAFDFIL
jgi:Ca2+-binding RTX toxin-like protein